MVNNNLIHMVEAHGHKFVVTTHNGGISIEMDGQEVAYFDFHNLDPENMTEENQVRDPVGRLAGCLQMLTYGDISDDPVSKTVWHNGEAVTSVADGQAVDKSFVRFGRDRSETIFVDTFSKHR